MGAFVISPFKFVSPAPLLIFIVDRARGGVRSLPTAAKTTSLKSNRKLKINK